MSRRRRKPLGAIDFSDPKVLVAGAVGLGLIAYLLWPSSAKAETAPARPPAPPPPPPGGEKGTPSAGGSGGQTPPSEEDTTKPRVLIGQKYTVVRGDSWSAIAKRSYGNYRWWPFLWDHNRRLTPTKYSKAQLDVGDIIEIPELLKNEAFRAEIFDRADEYTYWYKNGQKGDLPVYVATMTSIEGVSGLGYVPDLYTVVQPGPFPDPMNWPGALRGLGYGCNMGGC